MNVNSKEGRAWVGGKELAGAELKEALERGYGAWVNDTYWLLMPYKMTDPGVTLKYAGEEKGANGVMYDKVNLSFDNVGLTPKDTYWVWVNRDTGMVDRWDYVLKGERRRPPPGRGAGWTKHGNIMLAGERTNPKESRKLMLPGIAVMETMPDKVFTSPEPGLLGGVAGRGERHQVADQAPDLRVLSSRRRRRRRGPSPRRPCAACARCPRR